MDAFNVEPVVYNGIERQVKNYGLVSMGRHTLTHLGVKTYRALPGQWLQFCTLGQYPITHVYHIEHPLEDVARADNMQFIYSDYVEEWTDTINKHPGWIEWARPGGLMVFSHTKESGELREHLKAYNSNYHPFRESLIAPYPNSLVIRVEKCAYYRYSAIEEQGLLTGLAFHRKPVLRKDGRIAERDDSMTLIATDY